MAIKNLKLKAKIIERFGTQADFGEKIGEDESTISRIVCGRRLLSQAKKIKWAEVLTCEIKDIFPERTNDGSDEST